MVKKNHYWLFFYCTEDQTVVKTCVCKLHVEGEEEEIIPSLNRGTSAPTDNEWLFYIHILHSIIYNKFLKQQQQQQHREISICLSFSPSWS